MNQSPQATPQQNLMVLWMIWSALTSSVIVYLVVLNLGSTADQVSPAQGNLGKVLGGVAAVNILLSIVIRKRWTIPTIKSATAESFMHALPSCIISWALAEAVAVYGLVLGFNGHPMSTYGMFFIASFATLMFLTPSFKNLMKDYANS